MILIIGGRYQGKLEYAKSRFGLSDEDIFTCDDAVDAIDFDRRCVAYIDRWVLGRVRAGEDPAAILAANLDRMADAIVICTDISCGVVPADAEMRAWRDACGRVNAMLADRAGEVWRLFCGLPQRIK